LGGYIYRYTPRRYAPVTYVMMFPRALCVVRDERERAASGHGEASSAGDPAESRVPNSTRPTGSARHRVRVFQTTEPGPALSRPQGHDQGRLRGAPETLQVDI